MSRPRTARVAVVALAAVTLSGLLLALPLPAAWASCSFFANNAPMPWHMAFASSGTATVGTSVTLTATLTDVNGRPVSGQCVDFTISPARSGWPRTGTTSSTGHSSVTYTSNTVGTDSVTASTPTDGSPDQATVRRSWTAKPTPSPTPSPTTSPTKPPPSPTASPTRSPRPHHTASPTPSPSPSPSPTVSPSQSPSAAPTPSPSSTPPLTGHLTLNHPSTLPGGSVTVSGTSCPPSSVVHFAVHGSAAGTTTASPDGSFAGDVTLPGLPLGAYLIDVSCGRERGQVAIDLVLAAASGGSSGAGATAGAVLVFFVLLGSVLLTRNRRS